MPDNDKAPDEVKRPMGNPLPAPPLRKVKSPILEAAGEPGGPHTPGAKKKAKKKAKK